MFVAVEVQRDRQQGFQTAAAERGRCGKGRRLLSESCGAWSPAMASMMPFLRPSTMAAGRHRCAKAARAWRRCGSRAREFVQGEVEQRGVAGDLEAVGLGFYDDLHTVGRGDMRGVIAPAGHGGEADVALQHDDLGLARNARQAHARAISPAFITPVARLGSSGCCTIIRPKVAAYCSARRMTCASATARGGVGEGQRAGFGQEAHLGQFLASQAFGDGAVAVDLAEREQVRAAGARIPASVRRP